MNRHPVRPGRSQTDARRTPSEDHPPGLTHRHKLEPDWSHERPLPAATHTLCQLTDDPGERTGVSAAHPAIVQPPTAQREKLIRDGRSRPAKQP